MKKPVFPVMAGLLVLASAGAAQAQDEQGRVISSTPVVQQVVVPRQVCQEQVVTVPGQKSGAGAIMGGIAGGAMGNAVGDGSGRALATMIGLIGGAVLGNSIEGGGQDRTETVQQCSTQNFYENRTVAYNVVYEYAGRQYSTQMPQDPGPFVRLSVTPVFNPPPPPPPPSRYAPPPQVHYQPAAPMTGRLVGAPLYPAYSIPQGMYINGYRQIGVQPMHPRQDRKDRHDHRKEHRRDLQENRWERDWR
ncbi:MAG: hypothetical protein Q8M33_06030 [Hydrogenophaga sp.]|nr:hypothetical protein [Hydrogenophaga sp.]